MTRKEAKKEFHKLCMMLCEIKKVRYEKCKSEIQSLAMDNFEFWINTKKRLNK